MAADKDEPEKLCPIKVSAEVYRKVAPFADKLKWTKKQFFEECVSAICDLMENPGARSVPMIVHHYDLAVSAQSVPLPPNSKASAVSSGAVERSISERLKRAGEQTSSNPGQPPSSPNQTRKQGRPAKDPPK